MTPPLDRHNGLTGLFSVKRVTNLIRGNERLQSHTAMRILQAKAYLNELTCDDPCNFNVLPNLLISLHKAFHSIAYNQIHI